MADDSKLYRERAWKCAELAHTAKCPELKQALVEMSQNWLKLAVELERNQALMDMVDPLITPPRRGPA